jgi:drug/metabolite transporter (DMT)-like permease
MSAIPGSEAPPRGQVVAAMSLIYFVWGSTYLGIRFAIETMPPLLMTGSRFIIAGALLCAWQWQQGAARPTRIHWRSAVIIGGLMVLGGNGGVTWAVQRVPSGLAALMIGAVPIWIVMLDWLLFDGARPNRRMALGLTGGLTGLALLIGPAEFAGGDRIDPVGAVVLIGAAISWSVGSLYSRRVQLPNPPLLATGLEMLAGGLLQIIVGTLFGEWSKLDPGGISLRSAVALGYLSLFGSLVAFSAYTWLLRHTTPVRAASYAYVNPVVAVLLGWALAGEELTLRTMLAAAVIIGSVVVITSFRAQQGPRPRSRPADTPLAAAPSEACAGK